MQETQITLQEVQWRFLAGSGFTRAHPYSLSAAP